MPPVSRMTWLRGAVRVVGGESKILKLLTCFTGVKTPDVTEARTRP